MRTSIRSRRTLRRTTAAVVVALSLAASGCERDDGSDVPPPAARSAVVVASFSFPESHLLAEIYAQALEAAGVPVRREFGLGPRELVQPALQQGLVDVVPEYLGTSLDSLLPNARVDVRDVEAVRSTLDAALRQWDLLTLTPAVASNQNGFVVTRATAQENSLRALSDLRPLATRLKIGGTPECETREYCLVGLRRVYRVEFATFVPLGSEAARVAALEEGLVDVALMFTTDGRLADRNLVLLRDDQKLQPAENVVPVVSSRVIERYGDRVAQTLNRVSGKLTTQSLVFLNWRVSVEGKDMEAEARGWLRRQGVVTSPRPTPVRS